MCVYLQGAVQEAAVLSWLVAQPFTWSNGRHGARSQDSLHPSATTSAAATSAAARRKVVPLPRHVPLLLSPGLSLNVAPCRSQLPVVRSRIQGDRAISSS